MSNACFIWTKGVVQAHALPSTMKEYCMNWLMRLSHSAVLLILIFAASMQVSAANSAPVDPNATPELVQVGVDVANASGPVNYLGQVGVRTTVSTKGEFAFAVTVFANGGSEYKIEIEALKQTQTARSGSMGSPQYVSLGPPVAAFATSGMPVDVNVNGSNITITAAPGNTPAIREILRMQAISSSASRLSIQEYG